MKKPLLIAIVVNILILLIVMAFTVRGGRGEMFLSAGIAALILFLLNLIIGIASPTKQMRYSLLLVSAMLLLCSFTLCTNGKF